jgi:diaminopimelate decarboxylase
MMTSSSADPVMQVMPSSARRDDDGMLSIAGCRLDAVAAEFGTPTFVVDEQALRERARLFSDGLTARRPASEVAFASKSFPCTAVYRLMADEGLLIDVAGAGELLMALRAGVIPANIVLHGNAKTDEELTLAIDAGVGTIVIDGFEEIDRLGKQLTRKQNILVRVLPGVDPRTDAGVSTGQRGSKFGIPLDQVPAAVDRIRSTPNLHLQGVHMHLGSQMLELEPWQEAIPKVAGLGAFEIFDVGGGLGVQYAPDQPAPSIDEYLDLVAATAKQYLPDEARIVIEPGRSLVAQSTVTVYTVVTVKLGDPTFVAVDGGMADNMEASTYVGQKFTATLVRAPGGADLVNVVGRQCESGDRIAPEVRLDRPQTGDLVAVPMTGAYTHTLVNNYNGALRPPIVFCKEGQSRQVVRRETYDELTARDVPNT